MTRAIGANALVQIDEESTYKTDPGSPDGQALDFLTCGVKAEQNLLQDETINGNRNAVAPVQGNINVTGPIVVNLCENHTHALLLKHLLGSVATTGAGDPYTHTIKVGALPVGLVIEKGFPDITEYHKYNGCRVMSAEFAVTPEGFVQTTFNFIGATETRAATSYDATPTAHAYQAFSSFQGSMEEAGGAIATITNFSLSVSNELDEDGFAIDGSAERRDLPEGGVIVTGSIEAFFEDDSLLAKARAGTETSLKILLDKGGSPARSVELLIPELMLTLNGPEIAGPKGIMQSFDFTGYYTDGSEASSVQAIVINGQATL